MQRQRDDLRHHAELVDRMSSTLGVDLQEAAVAGRISIDQITDAVLACTACAEPDHCAAWLRQQPAGGVSAAPGYCRNKRLLTRLARAEQGAGQ